MYQSLIAETERNRAAAAAAGGSTGTGGPRSISAISNTVSNSTTVPGNDNVKRSRKLLRHMLEHAVVCTAPVRRQCGECLELRSALEDHAERCTRAACSMPFCGVSRGTMQAYLDNGGTTLNMTVTAATSSTNATATTSLNGDNKVRIKVSPKPSPSALDASNDFLSASSMGRTQGSPRSSRQIGYLTALAMQNTRQSPSNDASSNDDDDVDDNNNNNIRTRDDEAEDSPTTANVSNNRPIVHSAVTMLGNFDGCSTYSGRWFMDSHPTIDRPFGYVYRDEDVSDPDGSLPCAACGEVSPDSAAKFVVCDLCDQVFHLECANLDSIPEDSWFCSSCTRVRRSLLPTDSGSKVKLPPTRLWTGHFMFHDKKLSESFRLEFKWREVKDEHGVIADVSGEGKNVYGDFTISGKLSAPKPPKQSFPLELKKVYIS